MKNASRPRHAAPDRSLPLPERGQPKRPAIVPAYMNQATAAVYLGISVQYFRHMVDVTPIPFPGSTGKPVERYARADLDAWAEKWRDPKSRRSA